MWTFCTLVHFSPLGFSAFALLVGRQEEHPVMTRWHGYLSVSLPEQIRTATEIMKHCLLFSREIFYVSIVLCLSICLSVGHDREPCKNG